VTHEQYVPTYDVHGLICMSGCLFLGSVIGQIYKVSLNCTLPDGVHPGQTMYWWNKCLAW